MNDNIFYYSIVPQAKRMGENMFQYNGKVNVFLYQFSDNLAEFTDDFETYINDISELDYLNLTDIVENRIREHLKHSLQLTDVELFIL